MKTPTLFLCDLCGELVEIDIDELRRAEEMVRDRVVVNCEECFSVMGSKDK